jgi:hypothetical protein
MIGRTAVIDDLLAEVFRKFFLIYKVNVRRSVHSPQYRLIITLINLLDDGRD